MSRASRVLLGMVLLVAAGVRIHDLAAESIWADEGVSIQMARLPLRDIVGVTTSSNVANYARSGDARVLLDLGKPPLYFVLLHGWMRLFGDSEAAVRSLSAVLGTVVVMLTFVVGRLLMSDRAALFATVFAALAPVQVHYSQEARQYALLTCCAILSYIALLWFERRPDRRAGALYVVSGALTAYSHSVGAFVIAAQACYLAVRWLLWVESRRAVMRAFALQAAIAVASATWGVVAWQQYRELGGVFFPPVPTLYSVYETLRVYVGSLLLVQAFAASAILGVLTIDRVGRDPTGSLRSRLDAAEWRLRLGALQPTALLLFWIAVPIGALFVASHLGTPIYITRATIVASIGLFLLAARGITALPSRGAQTIVFATICMLLVGEVRGYYRETTRAAWRPAVGAMTPHMRAGDVILFHQGGGQAAFDYYVRRVDVQRIGFPVRRFRAGETLTGADMNTFPASVPAAPRVWLVLVSSRDVNGLVLNRLKQDHVVRLEERFPGIELYLFVAARS